MDRTEVRTSAFTRTSSVFDGNGLEFKMGVERIIFCSRVVRIV
jgi:hypothetical protein